VWAAAAVLTGMYLVVVALSFYQRVLDPTEYMYGESIVLDETHRLADGQPLYAPPIALPLTVTAYPPVYYVGVSLLQQLSGDSVGRIVSVAATVASTALIVWSVHRITANWAAGVLGGGLFVTQNLTVLLWGPTHRVDMLALCFALCGLATPVAAARSRHSRSPWLCLPSRSTWLLPHVCCSRCGRRAAQCSHSLQC
jgi:hypothetical protein